MSQKTPMISVFLPGESFGDYVDARNKSGLSIEMFEAKRLISNGWTAHMERSFRKNAHACGFGRIGGATPEQITFATMPDAEAVAEREAIQQE